MPKLTYRVRNWKEYNQSLVQRGSVTFWLDEKTQEKWLEKERSTQRGRPKKYSDLAIICGLTLKAIFRLTFRATEGFIVDLLKLFKLDMPAPDYTLLCKRQKGLNVALPTKELKAGENINIVVDSTGLKVFGEGEWKTRRHGYTKRRVWRKLHLAINSNTQAIEAFKLTDLGTQDCIGLAMLTAKIERPIGKAIADGAYDRFLCYEQAENKQFTLITPPQRNAVTSQERERNKKKASQNAVQKRDEVIKNVRNLGRKEWKVKVGYHRRSLAETGIYRIKTLLNNKLTSRKFINQQTEAAIWCRAINKITDLGMPKSVAIPVAITP